MKQNSYDRWDLSILYNGFDDPALTADVDRLSGAELEACDLRGGAAMVTAALFAEGVTKIGRTCYIERGYENIEGALRSVGADIRTG